MEKIDFVITWVDEADAAWREEKRKYEKIELKDTPIIDDSTADCRFRDNGLLRYWFRSVEKFAPWVNQIHFVTCGQRPAWLNVAHPKLHLVDHKDYMPPQYLPTFSSRAIGLNVHRIEELSERFAFFDDDTLLLQPVEPDYFFKHGLPVIDTDLRYTNLIGYNNWSRTVFTDYCVVKTSFNTKKSISKNWNKWFNIKELGFHRAAKNLLCYMANHSLPVSPYGHLASPQLKSTLQEIWDLLPEVLDQTSMHRFRSDDGVNPWLLCAWNQAKGQFYPTRKERLGQNITITPKNTPWICKLIRNGAIPQICINDTKKNTDFDNSTKLIIEAFNSLLPNKSTFELDC